MPSIIAPLARAWVHAHSALTDGLSLRICHGPYDGRNLRRSRDASGDAPVLLVIPPMSDVNGPLPHPGVSILQRILRAEGLGCEVINYNLPVRNPREPYRHLLRMIEDLGVRIVGVSTYSQAIRSTLEGLQFIRRHRPDVKIVLGGPHPTEAYTSLLGVSFIDYVCRGEAEESFPALVRALLSGQDPDPETIPGVYAYDRGRSEIRGTPARFIDLAGYDQRALLRYEFSRDEIRQMRLYRGCHGTAGAEYWPIALVRGCPYDCTFCAAYQMSGKRLRYREVGTVVDDLEHYVRRYGRRHFSFIDDAFTQHYEYVVALCDEILARKLRIYWTTDNGIRYETLGAGKLLSNFLGTSGIGSVDDLIAKMIRAGWRGTAVGIESGSPRVRRDLVRKGGIHLSNEEILQNLLNVKRVARREGVYFYINAFMMAGFPELILPNGKVVPEETREEMEETRRFARQLRDSGAIDLMSLSMVIPLPATDMWESLDIRQKLGILTSCVPREHPEAPAIDAAVARTLEAHREAFNGGRYDPACEETFWKEMYRLSDAAQILVMQSYDNFNADAAHKIGLNRPDPEILWRYREAVVDEFYGSLPMKMKVLRHVFMRSTSPQDVAAYVTLLARKFVPEEKVRTAPAA